MPAKKGKYVWTRSQRNPTHYIEADPQKRGPKSHFVGSRLKFLEGHLDEYASLRHQNRRQFWLKFYSSWWEKYPWRLVDDKEPPTDDAEKMKELSHVGDDSLLKAEVEEKLRDVSLR